MVDQIGRRQFLRLSAMAAAGATAVACQPQTVVVKETVEVEKVVKETVEVEIEKEVTTVVEKEVTKVVEKEKIVEVAGVSERQAPMFQEMVKAGTRRRWKTGCRSWRVPASTSRRTRSTWRSGSTAGSAAWCTPARSPTPMSFA
jgi:hypothetical protein